MKKLIIFGIFSFFIMHESYGAPSHPTYRGVSKKRNQSIRKKSKPSRLSHRGLLPKKPNREVRRWVKYYSQTDRKRFQRFLNRGARYKKLVQHLMKKNNVPADLYYLGLLESGYRVHAVSRAGAVGLWQFMKGTGRQYGLKINRYVDERRDPIRSTLAAVRYLKELHRQTRNWHLALSAYNAGPGRIRRAIRRGGGVRNYWSLKRRHLIPRETRHYVPQFLAMLIIGKNLKKYGFVERAKQPLGFIQLAKLPSPVKISDIAYHTKMLPSVLKSMNPHLIRNQSPPNVRNYAIWLPKKKLAKLSRLQGALRKKIISRSSPKLLTKRSIKGRPFKSYKISRGDNLTQIARKFKTTVSRLKSLNSLRSSRIFKGQVLRVADNR